MPHSWRNSRRSLRIRMISEGEKMYPHYFIAIPIPNSLKEHFSYIQSQLKSKLSYKQWPHKEDLHITLKFLGEVDDKRVGKVNEHLSLLKRIKPFELTVKGVGYFGRKDRPRVLWSGIHHNLELAQLKEEVELLTLQKGFETEKRDYKPHVTLAKKWSGEPCGDVLKKIISEYQSERFTLLVNEVILYKIHPKHNPKYEAIYRYRLKE